MKEKTGLEKRCNMLWNMNELFYSQENCICGGPLHVVLDDCNMDDNSLDFCFEQIKQEKWEYVRNLGFAILAELKTMNEAQRMLW
jgi:hypothetical protein